MTTDKILTQDALAQPVGRRSGGNFLQKLKASTFYIKLTNWEYWPLYISNLPLVFIWAWFAIRARKAFFFSAVNPAIETGGMWGESKFHILRRIPNSHVPVTIFVGKGTPFKRLLEKISDLGLSFPIIAKPNVGERGMLVAKIKDEQSLKDYVKANKIDFLIQEYIDLPLELAIMHHRWPDGQPGRVTSICIKETLKVRGDGKKTVRELMQESGRAKLQVARFEKTSQQLLATVPAAGQILELEPIGNHCRGTMFLNGNHWIDEDMHAVFNQVASQMEGIYYGRFDMKCASIEDLKAGNGFMVMEYNGIGAEPAHIYDPNYPLLRKYSDVYRHWRIIYRIYRMQRKNGVKGMDFAEALERFKSYVAYKKTLRV